MRPRNSSPAQKYTARVSISGRSQSPRPSIEKEVQRYFEKVKSVYKLGKAQKDRKREEIGRASKLLDIEDKFTHVARERGQHSPKQVADNRLLHMGRDSDARNQLREYNYLMHVNDEQSSEDKMKLSDDEMETIGYPERISITLDKVHKGPKANQRHKGSPGRIPFFFTDTTKDHNIELEASDGEPEWSAEDDDDRKQWENLQKQYSMTSSGLNSQENSEVYYDISNGFNTRSKKYEKAHNKNVPSSQPTSKHVGRQGRKTHVSERSEHMNDNRRNQHGVQTSNFQKNNKGLMSKAGNYQNEHIADKDNLKRDYDKQKKQNPAQRSTKESHQGGNYRGKYKDENSQENIHDDDQWSLSGNTPEKNDNRAGHKGKDLRELYYDKKPHFMDGRDHDEQQYKKSSQEMQEQIEQHVIKQLKSQFEELFKTKDKQIADLKNQLNTKDARQDELYQLRKDEKDSLEEVNELKPMPGQLVNKLRCHLLHSESTLEEVKQILNQKTQKMVHLQKLLVNASQAMAGKQIVKPPNDDEVIQEIDDILSENADILQELDKTFSQMGSEEQLMGFSENIPLQKERINSPSLSKKGSQSSHGVDNNKVDKDKVREEVELNILGSISSALSLQAPPKSLSQALEKIKALSSENVRLNIESKNWGEKQKSYQGEIERIKEDFKKAADDKLKLDVECQKLRKEQAYLNIEIENYKEQKLNNSKEQNSRQELEEELRRVKSELVDSTSEIKIYKEQLKSLKKQLSSIKEQTALEQANAYDQELRELKCNLGDREGEVSVLKDQVKNLRNQLEAVRDNALKEEKRQTERDTMELKCKLGDKEAEVTMLNDQILNLKNQIEAMRQNEAASRGSNQQRSPTQKENPDFLKILDYIGNRIIGNEVNQTGSQTEFIKKNSGGPISEKISFIERLIQMQKSKQKTLSEVFRDKFLNDNILIQGIESKLVFFLEMLRVLEEHRRTQNENHEETILKLQRIASKIDPAFLENLIEDVQRLRSNNDRALRETVEGDLDAFVHSYPENEDYTRSVRSQSDKQVVKKSEEPVSKFEPNPLPGGQTKSLYIPKDRDSASNDNRKLSSMRYQKKVRDSIADKELSEPRRALPKKQDLESDLSLKNSEAESIHSQPQPNNQDDAADLMQLVISQSKALNSNNRQ